jgi:hypothetical protein
MVVAGGICINTAATELQELPEIEVEGATQFIKHCKGCRLCKGSGMVSHFCVYQQFEPGDKNKHSIGDIMFPTNGQQPTSEQAALWSCANVDAGDIHSPVTEWYMRAFGWIPEDDTVAGALHDDGRRLQLGFCKDGTPSPVFVLHIVGISNDATAFLDPRSQLPLTRRQSFWYTFRQIAANPVGRVLLYRLLIEIRRPTAEGNPQFHPETLSTRLDNRRLYIEWDRQGFAYRPGGNPSLGFGEKATFAFNSELFCPPGMQCSCIGTASIGESRAILEENTPCDTAVFHELCHWYHLLRHPERYIDERRAIEGTVMLNGKDVRNIVRIPLGWMYWPYDGFSGSRWRVSALPWLVAWKGGFCTHFEEIRNILGSSANWRAIYTGMIYQKIWLLTSKIYFGRKFWLSNEPNFLPCD